MFATLRSTCLAAAAVAFSVLGVSVPSANAASDTFIVAVSALGDLTPYRTIASDTLALVDKGDITAARARIKDLETSWDKAEPTMKPKDTSTWHAIDVMIDAALTDLRTPSPKATDCAASLKALIAKMEAVNKA